MHVLNRRGSVLNVYLVNVWSQYGIESAIVKQTSSGSAVGKPKATLVEFYAQRWPCSNRRVQVQS